MKHRGAGLRLLRRRRRRLRASDLFEQHTDAALLERAARCLFLFAGGARELADERPEVARLLVLVDERIPAHDLLRLHDGEAGVTLSDMNALAPRRHRLAGGGIENDVDEIAGVERG